ncbi:MAG: hydantoinase/oxoprolinase family protein [Gammaproteobacteria bacterium]
MLLGIDTGGTFTDFVLFDGRSLRVHKVLSTPGAPEVAILTGVRELGVDPGALRVVHGSTVATNAVLEGKGVRTAYVTNRGFADVLTIARQARAELYNLEPPPAAVPVAAELCLETGGRVGADGRTIESLDDADLARLRAELQALAPEAVAVNLLFSFLDDRFERMVESAVPADLFVSRSSAVLPEYREYERGVATWLNSYVGPLVQGYLGRLGGALAPAPVTVMQSSGDTVDASAAGEMGVHLLLSGPAGGLSGAAFAGRAAGHRRLLTFDMGGTSTDVALIDGEPRLTTEGAIGPYPVAVPMVDMHTIGAGGGSIATVDAGGMLQVGPQSAGADPGPACYGAGGVDATVTDANLVLGRLLPDAFLGGSMELDVAAARQAVGRLAQAMGVSVERAAAGIVRVANEHMARALRVISVQRGIDPRTLVLTSFGGAGGLHVCALADALGMGEALVPVHAGVLSALGMLAAAPGRQLSRTLNGPLAAFEEGELLAGLEGLEAQGREALAADGVPVDGVSADRALDLRYLGQSYSLTIPWRGRDGSLEDFHAAHQARYGHRLDTAVELVNLRVRVRGQPPALGLRPAGVEQGQAFRRVAGAGPAGSVPLWSRASLGAGQRLIGPALITDAVATTWLAPGWQCVVDGVGNLLLDRVSSGTQAPGDSALLT